MRRALVGVGILAGLLAVSCAGEIVTPDETTDVFTLIDTGQPCPPAEGTDCVTITPPENQMPPEEGGCWITGIGTFGKGQTRDSFGGNGMYMKDGSVRGEWEHVDHFDATGTTGNGQNLFHGQVEFLRCEKFVQLPGPDVPKAEPNYATWGGTGVYNHEEGYKFQAYAWDHGEPGNLIDRYAIRVWNANGDIVLQADATVTPAIDDNSARETACKIEVPLGQGVDWANLMGCISGGNFQIHPANNGHPYGDGLLPDWATSYYP